MSYFLIFHLLDENKIITFTDPNVENKIMVIQAGYENILRYSQGMFADTHHILGAIIYGLNRNATGIRVDFSNSKFYYDEKYGNDWWSYYFNSYIKLNNHPNPGYVIFNSWTAYHGQLHSFSHYVNIQTRFPINYDRKHLEKLHMISKEYIHVRQNIVDDVENCRNKHIENNTELIGVHFRGSDKLMDKPMESNDFSKIFNTFKRATEEAISDYNDYKIFVASDEHEFKLYMMQVFGENNVFWQNNSIQYSSLSNNKSNKYESVGLHKSNQYSGYIKSYSAIFDMLMLSKSDYLIRSRSSLSDTSVIFGGTKFYYHTSYIDKEFNILKN